MSINKLRPDVDLFINISLFCERFSQLHLQTPDSWVINYKAFPHCNFILNSTMVEIFFGLFVPFFPITYSLRCENVGQLSLQLPSVRMLVDQGHPSCYDLSNIRRI